MLNMDFYLFSFISHSASEKANAVQISKAFISRFSIFSRSDTNSFSVRFGTWFLYLIHSSFISEHISLVFFRRSFARLILFSNMDAHQCMNFSI